MLMQWPDRGVVRTARFVSNGKHDEVVLDGGQSLCFTCLFAPSPKHLRSHWLGVEEVA